MAHGHDRSYTYVINSDSTTRKLLLPSCNSAPNKKLVFTLTEMDDLKYKIVEVPKNGVRKIDAGLKEKTRSGPKNVARNRKGVDFNKTRGKVFYNGEVASYVAKAPLTDQGMDQIKYLLKIAAQDEDRKFKENMEKDRIAYLQEAKYKEDKQRSKNKKYQTDLIIAINENAKKKEGERVENLKAPLENVIIGRQGKAKEVKEESKEYLRDLLENRRREQNVVVVSNAQFAKRKCDELFESSKLDQKHDYIKEEVTHEEDWYKAGLRSVKQKQLLDAQIKLAQEFILSRQKRANFERKNLKYGSILPVEKIATKKKYDSKEIGVYKEDRTLLQETINKDRRKDLSVETAEEKINNFFNYEQTKSTMMKQKSKEVNYRKSLERQIKQKETQRKAGGEEDKENGNIYKSARPLYNLKAEDLHEYIWKREVWPRYQLQNKSIK